MAVNAKDDATGLSLRSREPAFASMRECVLRQEMPGARGAAARVLGRGPLHPDARGPYRAAIGEFDTVGGLRRLGPGWTVLHAVPVAPVIVAANPARISRAPTAMTAAATLPAGLGGVVSGS